MGDWNNRWTLKFGVIHSKEHESSVHMVYKYSKNVMIQTERNTVMMSKFIKLYKNYKASREGWY
jgi:hypothetical protein